MNNYGLFQYIKLHRFCVDLECAIFNLLFRSLCKDKTEFTVCNLFCKQFSAQIAKNNKKGTILYLSQIKKHYLSELCLGSEIQ